MLNLRVRLFAVLACSYFVQGAHFRRENELERRIVVAPPVILPNHSTIWHVGQKATLSWNLTNIDPSFLPPDSEGTFVLGNPRNFSIIPQLAVVRLLTTNITIIVPDVPASDDYYVTLFGDSGDRSPFFIIDNSTTSFTSAMSGGHTPSPIPSPIPPLPAPSSPVIPMISTDLPTPTLSTSINPSSPFFMSSLANPSSSATSSGLGSGNSSGTTGGDAKLGANMKVLFLPLLGLFVALV